MFATHVFQRNMARTAQQTDVVEAVTTADGGT
jgi:hypothetical protein